MGILIPASIYSSSVARKVKGNWRMRYSKCLGGCLLFLTLGFASASQAVQIDLNDFFADPTVTVAADGSSALMEEDPDPAVGSVLLVNDPFFSDPNVIVPAPDTFLSFEYDFSEGLGEDDVFGAFVLDSSTGLSVGSAWEFFADTSSAGIVSFDLSSLLGLTLGLQFQLERLPGDTAANSTVTVANVALGPAPAPAPSALLLKLTGLVGF